MHSPDAGDAAAARKAKREESDQELPSNEDLPEFCSDAPSSSEGPSPGPAEGACNFCFSPAEGGRAVTLEQRTVLLNADDQKEQLNTNMKPPKAKGERSSLAGFTADAATSARLYALRQDREKRKAGLR